MTRLSADAVVSDLPSMGYDGLLKVRQAVELLLAGNAAAPAMTGPPDGLEGILFDAMEAELTKRGLRRTLPFDAFKRSSHYRTWRQAIGGIQDFLTKEFNGHIKDKRDKVALCRLLISTLCDELRERDIPLGYGTVASNISRLSEVFDRSFPGYLQCGMAHIVVHMLRRKGLT